METRRKKLILKPRNLVSKNLANLDLTGSNLQGADIGSADFSNTILADVNMKDIVTDQFTNFDHADFTDVIVDYDFIEQVEYQGTYLEDKQRSQINRTLKKAEDKFYNQVHRQICNIFLLVEEFLDNYSLFNYLLAGVEDIFLHILVISFEDIKENFREYQLLIDLEKNIASVNQIIRNDFFCKTYFVKDDLDIKNIKDVLDDANLCRRAKWEEIENKTSFEILTSESYFSFFKEDPKVIIKRTLIRFIHEDKPHKFHEIYHNELNADVTANEGKSRCVIS